MNNSKHGQDNRILIGGAATVRGKVRHQGQVIAAVCDDAKAWVPDEFYQNAPFDRINIIFGFGETNGIPDVSRIRKRELQPCIEVDMKAITQAQPDVPSEEELFNIFKWLLVRILLAAAQKYNLPQQGIRNEFLKLRPHRLMQNSSFDV